MRQPPPRCWARKQLLSQWFFIHFFLDLVGTEQWWGDSAKLRILRVTFFSTARTREHVRIQTWRHPDTFADFYLRSMAVNVDSISDLVNRISVGIKVWSSLLHVYRWMRVFRNMLFHTESVISLSLRQWLARRSLWNSNRSLSKCSMLERWRLSIIVSLNYTCICLGRSYSGRHWEISSSETILPQRVSKSFAAIAISMIISVATLIVTMDVLKYAFGIDPAKEELEKSQKKKKKVKGKRTIMVIRYLYVHFSSSPIQNIWSKISD